MRRVLASCAGGFLAAAAVCHGAWGSEPATTVAVSAPPPTGAAVGVPPSTPAPVSTEIVGSVPPPPGDPVAHDPAEETATSGEAHGEEATAHPAAPAATRPPMPFDIVRTLQFLQDQVARGNGRAIRVQALLLRRFGPTFVDADPAVWTDGRNRRAAILFTLSGGPPDVLRKLLAAGAFDEATRPLAEGALAYVVNDLPKAEKILSGVDLAAVEPGLAAQVHLVLGQIRQTADPAGAIARLDRARLLAPGGLVEEAALRLEVVLAQANGEPERADRIARQYFDRYSRSSYAGNFLARYAMVCADRPAPADPEAALASLLDTARRLDDPARRTLLLAVSRRSLVAGNLAFARLAGAEALKLDGTAGEDAERGSLYAAAAGLAASDGPMKAADELRAIDRAKLQPADLGLLDAATSVLTGIERPAPTAPDRLDAAELGTSPVLERAEKLLGAVAGDLGEPR